MKTIYILGAGGHGLVVAELAEQSGYSHIIFLDDRWPELQSCGSYLIQGKVDGCDDLIAFSDWVVAIGNNKVRSKLLNKYMHARINLATLIHPRATVSKTALIGNGTVIMAGAVVNAYAEIGIGCILNTNCSVDHESVLKYSVHLCPNVALAGNVIIGKETMLGISSNVIQGVSIGNNVVIGAGSCVIRNIDDNVVVAGAPAKEIKRMI